MLRSHAVLSSLVTSVIKFVTVVKKDEDTLFIILVTCALLLRWRTAAPPAHAQWLRGIMSDLNLEKKFYSILNQTDKIDTICGSPEIFLKTSLIEYACCSLGSMWNKI